MVTRQTAPDRRTFLKATAGTASVIALAGCIGGDDDDGNGNGNGTANGDDTDLDFGGETIDVRLNAGALAQHQRQNVIPLVEDKYNINVNEESSTTGQMIAEIASNPNNPPDVVDINVNGIFEAEREGWLASISEYTDIVENYDDVYDEVKHYDDHGVSWYLGEVSPVINEDQWDEIPGSWADVIDQSDRIALAPFSWTQGLILLLASSIATGESFDSPNLDVDAGFDWMEEHIKPSHTHTIEGITQANQLITQNNADVLLPAWDIWVIDPFQRGEPIRPMRRPDPVGIAAHQGVAVLEEGNVEPAMAYVNELLSVEAQEQHPEIVGTTPTNREAEIPQLLEDFGAPTIEDVRNDELMYPDFEFMWANQDEWSERWNQIFVD